MHKTVLIILAAVVALIVIVVLTGMRYLRADDEDDFDDESAAGRGQSRGRGEHPARDHWRSRHHDDNRQGNGHRQRPPGDREGAGRGTSRDRGDRERPERPVIAGVGAARRGSGRDDADRIRAGIRPGDRRRPSGDAPGRDAPARRGGERGWDDAGRDDRRNPGPRSRDYANDSADDLITASAASSRGSAGRGGMRPDDFDDRTARMSGRDPRGNPGQNARPDSRRTNTSQSRKDDSLPDIKPRPGKTTPGKSKRDGDGDWPSTEWDELSDVDYWAELASDKPFTSASPAPPSRPERDRADARSKTDSGPLRAVDRRDMADRRDGRDGSERREQLLPAARPTRQPADAAFTPPAASENHAANARTDAYGSTELRRAIASGRTSTSGQHRMPQPTGDDPLTSPSFPRISDDSRSYRRSGGRGQGESQSQTRPHSAYPPVPPHPPVGPLDSQPIPGRTGSGYSQPATSGMDYSAAPPVTSSYPAPAPAAPAASYAPPASNGYPAADPLSSGYSAPTPAANGYSAGYQAPLPAPSSASFQAESFQAESFRAESYPAGNGYSPAPAAASYPPQPAEQPGYSSYPDVGHAPAAQPQSTGFSYSQPADPGFAGQLPAAQQNAAQQNAAQQTDGYLGYQPPAHPAGVYQVPASGMLPPQSVQPGYPNAPYSAAPYEPPPVYPAPALAHEADGGYPADPYAVDPYGYPGYGSARLSDQSWRGRPLSDQRWDERSRQEQAWDDRSGRVQYGYQQYWEEDDR